MEKAKGNYRYLILIIYSVMMLFFIFKMLFYADYVGNFPDEMAHISYIAYLEQVQTAIPEYKDMKILVPISAADSKPATLSSVEKFSFSSTFNYLCHPPLYYQIMRLSGGVQVKNNIVTVNYFKLRMFNILLSALTMLLVFYMGYSRLGKKKNPVLHLLYTAIAVSVPMLAYICAGVNNDNLAFVAITLLIFGLLRFIEQKRNYGTYLLISSGVFLTFLSKLTAGLISVVTLAFFLLFILIREKNLWFLLSKKFLSTIPIYLAAASFFLFVYLQTGSISPTFKTIDPADFYNSGFYVAISSRTHLDFYHFSTHFITLFLQCWTGIASQINSLKPGYMPTLENSALLSLLFIPLLLVFQIKKAFKKTPVILMLIAAYLGIIIPMTVQLVRAYQEYVKISGYLGGYQSRYYLCGISAIALAITFIVKSFLDKLDEDKLNSQNKVSPQSSRSEGIIKYKKLTVNFVCLAFVALLFYEDFIYFLIHFKEYI